MIRGLVLLIALSQIPQRATTLPSASIEGVVVRSGGSKEPVEDARVELSGWIGQNPGDSVRRAVTTGKDGKFSFGDLDAGTYGLSITSNGYVRQYYPLSRSRLNLGRGQKLSGIAVVMTPTGSVSGRIRDQGGEPAANVPVQLMKYAYDDLGRRRLTPFGPSRTDRTDDRGEYRLFYITPGTYYLYVGNPWTIPSADWRDETQRQTYSYAFYPGVADSGSAIPIVVQPDSDIRGIDVLLERQPRFHIRGRILDLRTGRPPLSATVQLHLNGSSLDPQYNREYLAGEKATYEDGVFEFRNVMPGSYSVTGIVSDNTETECTECRQRGAVLPVNVVNANISNLFLSIPTTSSIRGRWRSEKQLAPQNRVLMGIAPESPIAALPGFYSRYDVSLNPDGTVTVDSVAPGNYRLFSRSLPNGFYVKEARFGGEDALAKPFYFGGDQGGRLDIVLGFTSAAVEGIATDEKFQPVAYATVVLVPSRNRDRSDLFRTATTSADGRFTLANVTPGDYRVFAWDAIELNAYFDPELLRQSEAKSVSVSLSDSSRRNISIRVELGDRLYERK
jgi:hypothetical protein